MEIEKRGVAELTQDPRNARSHDGKNIEAIKRSLQEFGQQKPIVIDASGEVVAGNGTLAAAVDLGWENIAVVETDLVGSSATAYAIADNRTAELASWDDEALSETVASLQGVENLLKAIGFSDSELESLLNGIEPPKEFKEIEADNLNLGHKCPQCGFEFSDE